MSEAKEWDLKPPEVPAVGAESPVVVLFPANPVRRPPPPKGLTAGEIEQLRQMMRDFGKVATACPIARKAIKDE